MTTTNALDTTARLELTELYARYTHAFDEGRADEVAELFAEDGAFLRPGAEPVRGRPALAAMVRAAAERRTGNRHLVSAVVVDSDGQAATGTAYVQVVSMTANALGLVAAGRYDDEFVHEQGAWRFRQRLFTPFTGPELAGATLAMAPASA